MADKASLVPGTIVRHGQNIFEVIGPVPRARKYSILVEGRDLATKGERFAVDPASLTIIDGVPEFDAIEFLGDVPSPERLSSGREWAEEQAVKEEQAGHPHKAEVWRRVAALDPGDEFRVHTGAHGMADDVSRHTAIFRELTPDGPKHLSVRLGNGQNRNLQIEQVIFNDLYKPGAQALGWQTAYDW